MHDKVKAAAIGGANIACGGARQPLLWQPPLQGYEHAVGRQSGASLARDGTELISARRGAHAEEKPRALEVRQQGELLQIGTAERRLAACVNSASTSASSNNNL